MEILINKVSDSVETNKVFGQSGTGRAGASDHQFRAACWPTFFRHPFLQNLFGGTATRRRSVLSGRRREGRRGGKDVKKRISTLEFHGRHRLLRDHTTRHLHNLLPKLIRLLRTPSQSLPQTSSHTCRTPRIPPQTPPHILDQLFSRTSHGDKFILPPLSSSLSNLFSRARAF